MKKASGSFNDVSTIVILVIIVSIMFLVYIGSRISSFRDALL